MDFTVIFTHEWDLGSGGRPKVTVCCGRRRAFHTFRFHCEFHTLCENETRFWFHSEITNPGLDSRLLVLRRAWRPVAAGSTVLRDRDLTVKGTAAGRRRVIN